MINPYRSAIKSRLFSELRTVPNYDYGSRMLLCIFIASATLGFFWIYEGIVYRGQQVVFLVRSDSRPNPQTISSVTLALEPDMRSQAVVFANADVSQPSQPKLSDDSSARKAEAPSLAERTVRQRSKKKTARVAKPQVPVARSAYATDFNFFSRPAFGGY